MRRLTIALISPPQRFAGGNTTTASRWEAMLADLGHRVVRSGERADLLVALHARKSARSIAAFQGPVVVAATGTDLYLDLPAGGDAAASFARADRIIVLNPLAVAALPAGDRAKARVIFQSVVPLSRRPPKDPPSTVVVLGHLRAVKDPLAVAEASRRLPPRSRIRVVQVGGAMDADLGSAAEEEARSNPRYRWLGELPRAEALAVLAAAHLLAVPSRFEGGPNAIGEAVVHGVPSIVSRIDGNLGLLGEDWPATFAAGDRDELAALLERCEDDPTLEADLSRRTAALVARFDPAAERAAWADLLAEVAG